MADDAEQFRWPIGYSPLHNVRPGVAYPLTLVTTGDHDDRVVPGTTSSAYDRGMRFVPVILLILSFPAGIVGYALGTAVVSALPLPDGAEGLLVMFVPLLVGGLFMLPFLIPFFDRLAKRDLEAYRRSKGDADSDPDEIGGGRD